MCAYWLTSSVGSSANAHGHAANRNAKAIAAGLGASQVLDTRSLVILTVLFVFFCFYPWCPILDCLDCRSATDSSRALIVRTAGSYQEHHLPPPTNVITNTIVQ
jgi:hypothetical protein